MKSLTSERFRECFGRLPSAVQAKAREAFRLWKRRPHHPSLQFKKAHATRDIYSVRIGIHWRAVGILDGDEMIWFWIGSHANYDNLLSRL